MTFRIHFNEEKNQLLKVTRGVCFDDAIKALENDKVLADIIHPSKKYKHQRIYILNINNYAYAVPYVINTRKKEIFLKTMFASRVFTSRYLKRRK